MFAEDIPYQESPYSERYHTPEERDGAWSIASALQEADGLNVSSYAEETAERYVNGEMSSLDFANTIESYHRKVVGSKGESEADIVAARILKVLNSFSFSLNVRSLMLLHKELFQGVDIPGISGDWVGKIRVQNLTKPEPVLGGRTVQYVDYSQVGTALDYDFEMERSSPYSSPMDDGQIKRFARFITHIWQAHPFREGNTRTTAVFSQLYLRELGCKVDNTPFRNNGKLYRDALVRASYASIQEGIWEDSRYIIDFYRSLIRHEPFTYKMSDLNLHGIRVEDAGELPYRADSKQTKGVLLDSNGGPSAGVDDLVVTFPEGISSSLDGSSPIIQTHE